MDSVAIYTDDDSTPMKEVMELMKQKIEEVPLPDVNGNADAYLSYFEQILPDYDRDRVMLSDIKKVVKWFLFLKEKDLLNFSEEEE
ncbi:hypothetical protein [Reichenbachiella sp.]|uniref:DUF6852 domain-containing protein n=1 Tax=Reichenbachiella sp. TaxID=2184521 RepID=UPI003B5CD5E9